MQRYPSCSDLEENSIKSTSTNTTTNVLKIIEHQQHQQLHIKTNHFKHLESSFVDNMRTSSSSSSSSAFTKISQSLQQPTNTPTRKKRLQRQKSTVYSGDETEYAADLEEEGDEEDEGYGPNERESNLNINLPAVSNLTNQKKKQVRFRNKQQSESSLKCLPHIPIEKTASTSSLTSSLNSSNTSCGSGHERRLKSDGSFDSLPELPHCSGLLERQKGILKRDNSIHSDSSRYSSVDSLLEARKPDPEAILINLGFGPAGSEDILSRIPKRFLKPSQVHGIDTEAFIKRLQLANTLADHSVLGYRGLTGNPDIPPSHIVAKIMQRFEVNERKKSLTSLELKLR